MLEKERSTENDNSYFGQGCGIAITTVFERNIEELFEEFMLFFPKEEGKNEATRTFAIAFIHNDFSMTRY